MHRAVDITEGSVATTAETVIGGTINMSPQQQDEKKQVAACGGNNVEIQPSNTASDQDDDDEYEEDDDDGSVSVWWGGIRADFRTLAVSIQETAGGVAQFVRTSAWNVAQEIAMLEETRRTSCYDNHHEHRRHLEDSEEEDETHLHLPWEIPLKDGEYLVDEDLKQKILQLSSDRDTFLKPFTCGKNSGRNEQDDDDFKLDEPRVEIIRQLLRIDRQLAATHAKLSGRVDVRETIFWRNYFHACSMTRQEHLLLLAEKTRDEISSSTAAEIGSQSSPNSLIPADELEEDDDDEEDASKYTDDSSFVCIGKNPPSAPSSVKTMRSVDSLVLIDTPHASLPNLM